MDKEYYNNKLVLYDHLETTTYEKVSTDCDKKTFSKLTKLIKSHSNCFTEKEMKYILNKDWKSSKFYVTPKIHKCQEIIDAFKDSNDIYIEMEIPPTLKARPIVSSTNPPTKNLSILLSILLNPLVPNLHSYIKDDWDFLRKLPRNINHSCSLYTVDIVSLYTSIPHELGIKAIEYYINKYRREIPNRFTTNCITDITKFLLENNNFLFNNQMFHQLTGTAMGGNFAPPYAILTIGYLEESYLYIELPKYFSEEESEYIKNTYKRFMDDGFIIWNTNLDIQIFLNILNQMHPSIKFTIESSEIINENQTINFLDVTVILSNDNKISTDIYYKPTNSHEYLNYSSHHPKHVKDNIPYNLAKRIVVFVSSYEQTQNRLKELRKWLLNCNYPTSIIEKGIFNAQLQGPAPMKPIKKSIPFVSTFYSNYSNKNIVKKARTLINTSENEDIKETFKDYDIVLAQKQPPNLLRLLTRETTPTIPGLYKCKDIRCKLCELYIEEGDRFKTSNNQEWIIKSKITCQATNVIYFLRCNKCSTTYIGKTNNFRKRMNNHISESNHGNTTDKFDKHVFKCLGHNKKEPFFKIRIMMSLNDESKLLEYEHYLHSKGYDTMNRKP